MKVCILYDSKHGTRKTCMGYLGSLIKNNGHKVDIFSGKEIKRSSIPEAGLYIFSAPTHFGDVSRKMKGFINKIDGKDGKKYLTINTCLAPENLKENKTIDTMEMILEEKGMKKAIESVRIKVEGLKGPADNNSQNQLKELANEIMKKLG
ncbi:MAG: flavodoxin domain-containing protein [Methanofastidiosum sp.]